MLFGRFCAFFFAAFLLSFQTTAAARNLDWADLIDVSAQSYDDPYRDLNYEQIVDVRTVLVERAKLEDPNLSQSEKEAALINLEEANGRLANDGLDSEWLISQRWAVAERRERAATAGNPGIDGQVITLSGFALAGPPAEDGAPVVYLVPERGMCSHIPPPNPNQMIRVRLHKDWTPSYAHEPVRLTGRVAIAPTDKVFHVVDGLVQMRATFLMETSKVETLADMRAQADPEATREWASQVADRLRAAGMIKSRPASETE